MRQLTAGCLTLALVTMPEDALLTMIPGSICEDDTVW